MKPDLEAYSGLPLKPARRSWWRPWASSTLECTHLESGQTIRVELQPDSLWLRPEAPPIRVREPAAGKPPPPAVTLCVDCLLALLARELNQFGGRVIAFEPEGEKFSRYVFVEQQHLGDVGLGPEDLIHCQSLVAEPLGGCQTCATEARFLWVKRGTTTDRRQLITYRGGRSYYCLRHGAEVLSTTLHERIRAPLTHFNFPYGERGVYIPSCD